MHYAYEFNAVEGDNQGIVICNKMLFIAFLFRLSNSQKNPSPESPTSTKALNAAF